MLATGPSRASQRLQLKLAEPQLISRRLSNETSATISGAVVRYRVRPNKSRTLCDFAGRLLPRQQQGVLTQTLTGTFADTAALFLLSTGAGLAQNTILGRQKRMPRATNSAKRQQGANNQRDTRHENGLVGPGKRIPKRKSQSQLDGSPRPAVDNANTTTLAQPLNSTTNGCAAHLDDMAPEHKATESLRRSSLGAFSESSSAESLTVPPPHAIPEEAHRRIDVNDAKNTNVHRDPGPLDLALTVLRSCPLHDTIAILIILMQISPAALTTIYMLFTFLTFVPPVTTSSGLSIAEIFDGNQGTPSLTTLVCMDVIMLGIWLFLWAPVQQFILDLAQVVISLTLGGGGTSRQGTANNIFLSVAIVGVSQWTRQARWNGLSQLSSLFGSNRFFAPSSDDHLESTVRAFEKKGPYGWVRSVLAIHILTQGLVRYIREWYLRRERRDLQSQSQLDPEAGKSVSFVNDGFSDAATMAADSDAHLQTSATIVSTKKRRKQSAQVRIRQPLWAALASTKIVMVKEYELSHAASESAGSNATDIHNLGNAPFNTQPEQIWICYVGCDEVCFNTSHFPDPLPRDEVDESGKEGASLTKPFVVRVNNAIWQPTRMIPVSDDEEEKQQGTRWTGDIYGLTPLSNYECEFVSTRTGEVIFSTSVRTVQAKSNDQEVASKAASNQRSHNRHDSPSTTLRASIAAAEAKFADEKARLKAVRKDNNRKVNSTRKEIEKLTAAVQSAGGDDEKLRQKVAQNKIQEKRAEEAISSLEAELKELERVPEDLLDRYRAQQSAWSYEKAQFDEARATFKSFKALIDTEIKALEEEKAVLQAKRNKIATRIAKVDTEHARITDANAQGLDEAERRLQQRNTLKAEIARAEQNITDRINAVRALNLEKQGQVHDMASQMQAYLTSFQDDVAAYDQAVLPQPSQYTNAQWGAPSGSQFGGIQSMWPPAASMTTQAPSHPPPSQLSSFANPMQTTFGSSPHQKARGRSSSMLSDVSGLTQSTDSEERNSGGHLHQHHHHHHHQHQHQHQQHHQNRAPLSFQRRTIPIPIPIPIPITSPMFIQWHMGPPHWRRCAGHQALALRASGVMVGLPRDQVQGRDLVQVLVRDPDPPQAAAVCGLAAGARGIPPARTIGLDEGRMMMMMTCAALLGRLQWKKFWLYLMGALTVITQGRAGKITDWNLAMLIKNYHMCTGIRLPGKSDFVFYAIREIAVGKRAQRECKSDWLRSTAVTPSPCAAVRMCRGLQYAANDSPQKTREFGFPICIPRIPRSVVSLCSSTDFKCICESKAALVTEATPCVLKECGFDVAVNQVLPATTDKFCAAALAGGNDKPTTSAEPEPTSSASASESESSVTASKPPASTAGPEASTTVDAPATAAAPSTTFVSSKPSANATVPHTSTYVTAGAAVAGSMGSVAMLLLGALAAF
ncbi:hypothetical protein B0T17DRAFT_503842 [Bombardia bombarda]|uniref:CFEM domain-containing protein n=1 Tax=Bombardia bombarda TaxID=252184 RepID=A0AA39XM02_9PEZI|nr:hypothetical protein B0T17DRAFT_503842 [Bombardia bombarda]